jgi:hypothetical protein
MVSDMYCKTFNWYEEVVHSGDSDELTALRTLSFPRKQNGSMKMERMEMQAVLTSLVADFVMRSKLTLWRHPTAKVNGGWCMCLTKQEIEDEKVCASLLSCYLHHNTLGCCAEPCMIRTASSLILSEMLSLCSTEGVMNPGLAVYLVYQVEVTSDGFHHRPYNPVKLGLL